MTKPNQLDLAGTTDLCRLLGDPTRLRLLTLLEMEDLTVAELTKITRLPQPRVSTHLGRLREAGLVRVRRRGTSAFYAVDPRGLDGEPARLWRSLCESTADPILATDGERARQVVAGRGSDESWAERVAGTMQRYYSPGRTWESLARGVVGIAALGDVLDIACGDGVLAQLFAPHARSVTCLDRSPRVLEAASRRIGGASTVRFLRGDMHRLPFASASFDHVLLLSALVHAEDPACVLTEAARVLRPEGRLLAVTLRRHEHHAEVERYDHVNSGQDPDELRGMLVAAGFEVLACDVTSREKRPPHFEVLTVHARRLAANRDRTATNGNGRARATRTATNSRGNDRS